MSYVLVVEWSVDPLIVELRHSVLANSPNVSPTVLNSLSAAKASVANIHSATFKNHACYDLRHTHIDYWESKFETLTVQNYNYCYSGASLSFMEEIDVWPS